ncbi:interferon-induced helicase C domain-containing protein 1-like isoform X2 [Saccostrea cucullata]|uniref:interferon-induced helicase C domain-containing protein 1-like isoform X1 n=1 Tax=Saccostrea cuccullata TaxID=36930 RepID=UPI002ED59B8E
MEIEKKLENIDILSDEENEEMDTKEQKGLNLRLFQIELTEIAKRGCNTIVCSDTGTGKTRIAFDIIKDHLKKNPEGHVGVLANNAVLVAQHYKAVKLLLPEYEESTMMLTGSSKLSKNLHLFAKFLPIIIMTPALILNTIDSGNDPEILSSFTLLVFDECHHTYGEHIFNKVMRRYHIEKDKGYSVPQILGLTATLGTGAAISLEKAKTHIIGIMANLDVEELSIVTKEKENYDKFLKNVKTEIIQLPKQPIKDSVDEVIETFMAELERKVQMAKDHLSENDEDEEAMRDVILGIPDDKRSNQYITWCKKLEERAHPLMGKNLPLSTEIKLYAKYFKILSECLEINLCLRGESTLLALEEKLERENLGKPSLVTIENDLANRTENMKKKMTEMFTHQSKDRPIDKLLKLLQENVKQDSVIIIFVRTRELVFCLEEFLKRENYKFGRLTGQQSGDGAPAMSQKQQDDVINKLNAGELQGIIATDIAGEGLNIERCSGAIRYMCVGNEITSRQFKGRIRKDEGTYITIGEGKHTIREHLNTQRALLMTDAVNEICNMRQEMLKEKLKKCRYEILLEEKRKQQKEQEESLSKKDHSEYAVSCTRCGKFDIDCENIFLIKGTHHAVIDKNKAAKITQKRLKKKPYKEDDLEQLMEWYHDNCAEKLGTVYLYKGIRLPVMGQGRFVYYKKQDKPRKPLPIIKWKFVPFEKSLREIGEEQLMEMSGVL